MMSCRASEVVDDLGDHTLGHMGLAETDLVGHQEPDRGILVSEHPLECPTGGSPLEVLQIGQDCLDIDGLPHHRDTALASATS